MVDRRELAGKMQAATLPILTLPAPASPPLPGRPLTEVIQHHLHRLHPLAIDVVKQGDPLWGGRGGCREGEG